MSKSAEAAGALFAAFGRAVPAEQKKRLSDAEWAAALSRFHVDAVKIRNQFRLGVFGRAAAAYHFQKQLLASDMRPDLVRKVVFSLVLNAFIANA